MRTVDEIPASTRTGRPSIWPDRLREARKVAPKVAVWDYDKAGSASSAASAARRVAKGQPGRYEITARTVDGVSSVYVKYVRGAA